MAFVRNACRGRGRAAAVAASMSIFISGMWLGWMTSVTEKFVKRETGVDVDYDQLSWVVSLMDLGTGVSPLFTGWLMDRYGRRPCIVALGPLFLVSWLLALLVPTTWALYVARFMAGLGKGASYTVVPVFLGEIASADIRGALGTVFTIQVSGGVLFEVIVGPHVSYRALNAASAAVPVLFFVMFLWVPESPYHLLKRGRQPDAARCLRWYRCGAADVDDELRRMEVNVRKDMESASSFRELFANRKNRGALMVVVTASACHRAGGISSITAYAALILPDHAPVTADKYAYVTAFAVALVAVNFVGLALVDRVGRKPLLVGSEAALGAITFLFGVYYCARDHVRDPAALAWLPYTCYVAFAVAYAAGVGFVPVVLMGEMFPANVRSQCAAVVAVTLAACSFASNKVFLTVSRAYGYHVMFWLFAAINLGCAYCAQRYALETNGKTFQEIQEMLDDTLKTDDARKEQRKTAERRADVP